MEENILRKPETNNHGEWRQEFKTGNKIRFVSLVFLILTSSSSICLP